MAGERVVHKKFGKGEVTGIDEKHVTVRFDSGAEKIFLNPQAFTSFLKYEDEGLQQKAEEAAGEIQKAVDTAKHERHEQFEAEDNERREQRNEAAAVKKKNAEAKAAREEKAAQEAARLRKSL
ncbi:MAG: hypothetical protein ACOX8B_04910 [Lachnospiraceae bacterium]|jgi:alpha-glucosidase (family GH31 glycosyl hydrolase)